MAPDEERARRIITALDANPTKTLNAFAWLLWTTLFAGIALGLIFAWLL